MLKGLIGKKIGMTQIFDEKGVAYPVTIIEAGPCYVTQVRSQERDGYAAVQVGFGEIHPKKLTGGELGHLKAGGLSPMRFLREFTSAGTSTAEACALAGRKLSSKSSAWAAVPLMRAARPGAVNPPPATGTEPPAPI